MMNLAIVILILVVSARLYWAWLLKTKKESPPADETHRIRTEDGWRITLYRYASKTDSNEPVFFCHGISGSQFCFSYPKNQSMVDSFTEAGFDCWVIDLRGNRSSEPPPGESRFKADFDDFLYRDIPAALDFIEKKTGHHRIHWVGHSMGGMLLYAYASVFGSERILSGTTLGAPPGFTGVRVAQFDFLKSIIAWWPSMAERFMQAATPLVELVKFSNSLVPVNWRNMHSDVIMFNVLELPSMDLAHQLTGWATTNTWTVNNDTVDVLAELPAIECPLLVMVAPLDTLAPPKNQTRFFDQVVASDKKILYLSKENGYHEDYNHVDLIFSKHGVGEVHRPIIEWMQEHPSTSSSSAPAHLQVLLQTHDAIVALDTPAPPEEIDLPELDIPIAAIKPDIDEPKTEQWTSALSSAAHMLKDFDKKLPRAASTRTKKALRKKPSVKKASPKNIKAKAKKKISLKPGGFKKKPAAKKKTLKIEEKPSIRSKPAAKKKAVKISELPKVKKKAATKKKAAKISELPKAKKKAALKKKTTKASEIAKSKAKTKSKVTKKTAKPKTKPKMKKKTTAKKPATAKKKSSSKKNVVKKKTTVKKAIKKPVKKKALRVKKKTSVKKGKSTRKKKK